MKVSFILSIGFVLLIQIGYSQIPNNSFEDWEFIENYQKPSFWNTNQDSTFMKLERDSISVEGDYSLKFYQDGSNFFGGCDSRINTQFKLAQAIGINKSLTFYAKSLPYPSAFYNSVYLRIYMVVYENGSFDSNYDWSITEKVEEFTKFQIPIPNPTVDSIQLWITGGADGNSATDGCIGRSYTWIDGLSIEDTEPLEYTELTSLKMIENTELILYPNPAKSTIYINDEKSLYEHYQLISIGGKYLESGPIINKAINLSKQYNGLYLIKLFTSEGEEYKFEINRIVLNE